VDVIFTYATPSSIAAKKATAVIPIVFAAAGDPATAEDIAPAFDALKGRADALYLCSSPTLTTNRIRVSSLALGARLPTMYGFREFTVSGGLMSYGPNFRAFFIAPRSMSTRFCAGRSLANCRSSSQRSSSSSSI